MALPGIPSYPMQQQQGYYPQQQQQYPSYQPQFYQQHQQQQQQPPQSEHQTADLWLKIDQHHLNYLKAEEGTKKLDIQKKLDGETKWLSQTIFPR